MKVDPHRAHDKRLKRAKKTAKKTTKKIAKTHVSVIFHIDAPHASIRVGVDCDKTSSKQMPELMRQLAGVIESGDFDKEINKLAGVHGITLPR